MKQEIVIKGLTFEPFIAESHLVERVGELAQVINRDYRGKTPIFLPILNGAFIFAADLYRHIAIPSELSFMKLSSYRGERSSGSVQRSLGLSTEVRNRHLLIVEDIVDTGQTLAWLLAELGAQEPASIEVVTLLQKPAALLHPVVVKYVGFDVSNDFVVGYGLDYDQEGRNLRDLYRKVGEPGALARRVET